MAKVGHEAIKEPSFFWRVLLQPACVPLHLVVRVVLQYLCRSFLSFAICFVSTYAIEQNKSNIEASYKRYEHLRVILMPAPLLAKSMRFFTMPYARKYNTALGIACLSVSMVM